ncbi:hypothetical protein L211DRAFT_843652, partial [Terfezia boudieri ATCC MYA-4762]
SLSTPEAWHFLNRHRRHGPVSTPEAWHCLDARSMALSRSWRHGTVDGLYQL